MKPTRCAAWFAPDGNASYFPALLFARVGAEDPRYPRASPVATRRGEPGGISTLPRLFRVMTCGKSSATSRQSRERTR